MLNVLLILAKLLIHKGKFLKTPPVFKCLFKELQLYMKSLKLVKSKFSEDLYIVATYSW